jgi:hypothetical protein
MPEVRLHLRLDPHETQPNWLWDPAAPEFRKSFYRSFGLGRSDTWATIDPATPKGVRALDRIELLVKSGAVLLGEARLQESLTGAELDACEWFELGNRFFKGDPGFSLWDDYPSCRSAAIPNEVHLTADVLVSEAFRAVVEAERLRGLEFLRVKEKSRKPKLAWYVGIARQQLGQGVDHPWLDRGRWEQYLRDHASRTYDQDPTRPPGHFSGHWVRDDAGRSDALLARLLRLVPEGAGPVLEGLTVLGVPRYWRERLPAADFAYVPAGRDGPNREGKILRFRKLCARRRARDALLAAGLIREQDAEPLLVVDEPPAGAPNLDLLYPPAPPMYSDAELAALRAQERATATALATRRTPLRRSRSLARRPATRGAREGAQRKSRA